MKRKLKVEIKSCCIKLMQHLPTDRMKDPPKAICRCGTLWTLRYGGAARGFDAGMMYWEAEITTEVIEVKEE